MERHTYRIEFDINGGEYSGVILMKCSEITQVTQRTIVADGVVMTLEEDILSLTRVETAELPEPRTPNPEP